MSLRVLHVLFGYYPDPIGGTEVYVEALARYQSESGLQVCVAAPGKQDAHYQHNGLEVYRFALSAVKDLGDLYGDGDSQGADALARIAKKWKADVVHFHAFTRGVSLLAAKKVRVNGAALVVTYHTPTVSCARGTMMRWGAMPCSGILASEPCAACALNSKGMSVPIASALSQIPRAISNSAKYLPSASLTTALRMPALLRLRENACLELFELADHWVGVCDWVCDVLRSNGIEDNRLTLSRQGVSRRLPERKLKVRDDEKTLRLVMLGRIDSAKGWHIVLDALRQIPELLIDIDAYAVSQNEGSEYANQLRQAADKEPRFHWCEPLPSERMLSRLPDYDALLVPSQWLETGPLVVLEAFEAGLPVIGSDLGGIAELVHHEHTGFLVSPYNEADAWAKILTAIARDRDKLASCMRNIESPRGMPEACQDMMSVYRVAIEHRAGDA
jgi:glycosyltransferase involved in cell wall biosynthesis